VTRRSRLRRWTPTDGAAS